MAAEAKINNKWLTLPAIFKDSWVESEFKQETFKNFSKKKAYKNLLEENHRNNFFSKKQLKKMYDLDMLDYWEYFWRMSPYSRRNYSLFSVLADVRNGGQIVPIDSPRGLPDDIHPFSHQMLSGDHSQSWLLLPELIEYNWENVMKIFNKEEEDAGSDKEPCITEKWASFVGELMEVAEYLKIPYSDIRIVFDFDS